MESFHALMSHIAIFLHASVKLSINIGGTKIFSNLKNYFIYFNTLLYNSPNTSYIFFTISFKYLFFIYSLSLSLTLLMWLIFFILLFVQYLGPTCLSWERNKILIVCLFYLIFITCSYSELPKMEANCSSLANFFTY